MTTPAHKDISVRGTLVRVPAVELAGLTVIVTGRVLRMARVHDAEFAEAETALDPSEVHRQLESAGVAADIFTFAQRPGHGEPAYAYFYDWDNAAIACSANYDGWWNSLPQESRKNVRRAGKRGVTVEVARLDDGFARGIKALYDETPVRQGRRFWHYGKDLEAVRNENSSYPDRSEFIGAYHDGTLIGFTTFVYAGDLAVIMQILASAAHQDKRPMNALIAKAMEVCHRKGVLHLVYGRFTYGNKRPDAMAEFKRRNGFEEARFPRYFVPLTLGGRLALTLRLHRGLLGLLPPGVIQATLAVRGRLIRAAGAGRAARLDGVAKAVGVAHNNDSAE